MPSDLTITISSVAQGESKYKHLSHKTYTVKAPVDPTPMEQVAETTTRSGRISKKPVRYEPIEQVMDDYNEDEYDTDDDE